MRIPEGFYFAYQDAEYINDVYVVDVYRNGRGEKWAIKRFCTMREARDVHRHREVQIARHWERTT